ncbi:Ribosomal protein S19e [Artemisia annua]|uniref:Ribosomal protein S19e n=1 Tax=Artemisia annua TaxID=35608 RepID=A0A2U1NUS9_ARTAN|nr:Ribosomal protein S19e [Artemisia annua]
METARTVKDVSPHEFVKAYAAHLKRSDKHHHDSRCRCCSCSPPQHTAAVVVAVGHHHTAAFIAAKPVLLQPSIWKTRALDEGT